MTKVSKTWVQIKVLLEPTDHRRLADAAHACRLPISNFARELLLGRLPKIAPPLVGELSLECQELLKICQHAVGNLRQLDGHGQHMGEPLCRLSGPAGPLAKLSERVRMIGLKIKCGEFPDAEADALLTKIFHPANSLNDLARSLNSEDSPGRQTWYEVLTSLQSALEPSSVGNTS